MQTVFISIQNHDLDKTIPYYKNLDALRFYAVSAVFLFHYFNIKIGLIDNALCAYPANIFKTSGYLGVDFFFTLSGFLITSILLSKDSFDLAKFYQRRALRIMPLYLAIVIIGYGALPYILRQDLSLPPLVYVLSFTANYFYVHHGDHYLFAITLLWSISIEMQFYLIWGVMLRFLGKDMYLLSITLIIISLVIKYLIVGQSSLYFISETYVPDFMIGALGAKLLIDKALDSSRFHKAIKLSWYILAFAVFISTPYLNVFFVWRIFGNCVYSALFAGIIIDQSMGNSLFEAGRNTAISYLGKVSYGIYCFQGFVLPLYTKLLLPYFIDSPTIIKALLMPVLLFAVTGVLAAISYRYYESYFIHLKETV